MLFRETEHEAQVEERELLSSLSLAPFWHYQYFLLFSVFGFQFFNISSFAFLFRN